MPEIEAKFLLRGPAQTDEVLRGLAQLGCQVSETPTIAIADIYVDTPDWRVLRAGWACRRRRTDAGAELMLKSLHGGQGPVFSRTEISQSVDRKWRPREALPKGPVRKRVTTSIDGAALRVLFRLHTSRRVFDVKMPGHPDTRMELALDHTTIRGRARGSPMEFTELELELLEGDAGEMAKLAALLGERLGLLASRLSKFERGLQAAHIHAPLPMAEPRAPGPGLTPKSSMLDLACTSLERNLAKLKLNEPRAWEGIDPEGVHQMRVAIRRLRAALKTFRNLLPADWSRRTNKELRWLARTLGTVRDADVYEMDFDRYLSALPEPDARALANYRSHLADLNRDARNTLLQALAGERYHNLLSSLAAFLAEGPSPGRQRRFGGLSVGYGAEALVREPLDAMLQKGAEIDDDSPDEALHELRILGKRVRYQTEFFVGLYPQCLKKFLKACRKLQDVLGEHQDAAVACERLRGYAATLPTGDAMRQELLALGRLVQIQSDHGAQARARFRKRWRRFSKAAKKAHVSAPARIR